jgi:hypothetical protein
MTIKELMAQANVNRVTDAFLLLDYNFSAENFENSFIEKYEAVPKLRKIIEENIRLFAECTANVDTVPHTIFIIYSQDDEDYENKWKKRLSGFAICDEEALPVIDKDFHIFDDEGEARILHYSFDNAPMQEMANYVIAQSSLNEFGKEICVAKILSELFFWGAFPKEREKKINELYESASKPIDKKELVDSKVVEDKMREIEEQLMLNMSDDEKAYYLAKKRFEEETEDIIKRYWHRVGDEIHKQYIDAIKAEYKGR